MRYIRRLKYTSLYKYVLENAFTYVIIISLLLFAINKKSILAFIILITYSIYLVILNHKVFFYIIIIVFIICVNLYCRKKYFQSLIKENYCGIAKVEMVKKLEKNYQIKLKLNKGYVLYYSEEQLNVGDVFYIEGVVKPFYREHYPGGFNHYQYSSYKNIFGNITISKIKYLRHKISKYYLNSKINLYYQKNFDSESLGMIKALTIGNKDIFDKELNNSISNIGISHLFVISGLHVNIIAMLISKVLKIFLKKVSDNIKDIIAVIFLFLYYILSGYLISVFRVVFGYLLHFINNKYCLKLNSLNLISIQVIIILLVNPMFAFQYNFLLSYVISISIILCNRFLKKGKGFKNNIINMITISALSIIITLPIVVNINPDINFLSIVYNLFYIPLITYLILPLSFITTFIRPLEKVFIVIYEIFKKITIFLSNIKLFTITYPIVPTIFIIIYYFLIVLFLNSQKQLKKVIFIILAFIFINLIWINICFFEISGKVYFLDLPKGEATLIKDAHNKLNILIDTGEQGYEDIILFLKKQGVSRLDSIIISHGDSDHNGMLDSLIREFNVKEVCSSIYDEDTSKKSRTIIQRKLSYGNKIKFNKNLEIEVLSPVNNYMNKNNNSLVLLANIFNEKYLFTGDIEKVVEKDLKYIGEVLYLKVPHHGSNTSSSDELLSKIKYKRAICMNGYKNSFSFPSFSIEKKYQDKLYVTSREGTLEIKKYIHKTNKKSKNP